MFLFLVTIGLLSILAYSIAYTVCLTYNKWEWWIAITLLTGFAMYKTLPSYVGLNSPSMYAGLTAYAVLSVILALNWLRKLAVTYNKPKSLRIVLILTMLILAFAMIYSEIFLSLFDAFTSLLVYLML